MNETEKETPKETKNNKKLPKSENLKGTVFSIKTDSAYKKKFPNAPDEQFFRVKNELFGKHDLEAVSKDGQKLSRKEVWGGKTTVGSVPYKEIKDKVESGVWSVKDK